MATIAGIKVTRSTAKLQRNAGKLTAVAIQHLIKHWRAQEIKECLQSNHFDETSENKNFLHFYGEERNCFFSRTYATFPEERLDYCWPERVDNLTVTEPSDSRWVEIKGVVLFRNNQNNTFKLEVSIKEWFADNGNHYRTDSEARFVKDPPQEKD